MQSIHKQKSAERRSGFTLIELMVVIMIISIISGIVLTSFNTSDNSRALNSGVSRLESLFTLARSAAITRKQTTRLLISFDNSNMSQPNKPQRMLRYATIVYLDDTGNWKLYSEGEFLPEGIYFSPALSTKGGVLLPLFTWTLTIDDNLNVSSPAPTLTQVTPYRLVDTNKDDLRHGAAANKWYAFEFAPNGTSRNAGARVVLVSGILQSATELIIPVETGVEVTDNAKGFVIFRSGKVLYFQSGEQIKEGN